MKTGLRIALHVYMPEHTFQGASASWRSSPIATLLVLPLVLGPVSLFVFAVFPAKAPGALAAAAVDKEARATSGAAAAAAPPAVEEWGDGRGATASSIAAAILFALALKLPQKLPSLSFATWTDSSTLSLMSSLPSSSSDAALEKGSPRRIDSRTLRATCRTASLRWREGVQSRSMSTRSPSSISDPSGKYAAPDTRKAPGA
mmetsp:Transcript_19153/g.55700  ORF Transcript_19153/g.55700 Transcript_19153/m.55700 type:complete len:202 (-) Transcript_19153:711-1316(-)